MQVCEVLLRHPSYVHIKAAQGWHPIHVAAHWGHPEVLLTLLTHVKDCPTFVDIASTELDSEQPQLTRVNSDLNAQLAVSLSETFTLGSGRDRMSLDLRVPVEEEIPGPQNPLSIATRCGHERCCEMLRTFMDIHQIEESPAALRRDREHIDMTRHASQLDAVGEDFYEVVKKAKAQSEANEQALEVARVTEEERLAAWRAAPSSEEI